MQDRFKYRAWNKINKTMKEVTQITLDKKQTASMSDITEKITVHLLYQPHFVLMQCTGLKDVNGKLIFEGDRVYIGCEDEIATIQWSDDLARFTIHFEDEEIQADFDNYNGKELEVIGNIYESPELIGGAEC